jgi:hypothetical protein
MLFAQIWVPVAQAMPQPPQWSALLARSAHTPPQSIWGAVQLTLHIPPTHDCPTLQTVPHAPQFCGSIAVLAMQVLPSPPESPVSLLEHAASAPAAIRAPSPKLPIDFRKLIIVATFEKLRVLVRRLAPMNVVTLLLPTEARIVEHQVRLGIRYRRSPVGGSRSRLAADTSGSRPERRSSGPGGREPDADDGILIHCGKARLGAPIP